jgi:Family of unknown function (DUF6804)
MRSWNLRIGFLIARLICVAVLLLALGRHSYGYYSALRWLVCGASVYGAWLAMKHDASSWAWVFGIAALAFNSILPLRLGQDLWHWIAIVTAAIFALSILVFRPSRKR